MIKLYAIIVSVLLSASLIVPVTSFAEKNYTVSESSTASDEIIENKSVDSDSAKTSKALKALVIIGVFTLTFAVSGVATYKMKTRKLFDEFSGDNSSDK